MIILYPLETELDETPNRYIISLYHRGYLYNVIKKNQQCRIFTISIIKDHHLQSKGREIKSFHI